MLVRVGQGLGFAMAAPTGGAASGSSYVRLRGLPFTATEQEVAHWFAVAPGAPMQVHRVVLPRVQIEQRRLRPLMRDAA